MVTEGQAEPWETVTTPASLPGPRHVQLPARARHRQLQRAVSGSARLPTELWAFLFWGAEYWLKRRDQGDDRYLAAFSRVLAGRLVRRPLTGRARGS